MRTSRGDRKRRTSPRAILGGAWSAALAALTVAACFLPDVELAGRPCPCTAGYVCDEATQRCVTPGTGGAGATSTGTGTSTTTATSTSTGAGGQAGVPLTPLVASGDIAAGAIALTVDKAFRLEFTQQTYWQPQRWLDLPTSDVVNLSAETSRDILLEPIEMSVGGNWYGIQNADFIDGTLTDETPARAIIDHIVELPPGVGFLSVHDTFTVYASGRVGVRVVVTNQDTASQSFDAAEVMHTSVNEALPWANATFSNGHAAMFQRSDGATPRPTVLSISADTSSSPGQDFATNYYWDTGGMTTLAPGETFERTGELQIGLGDQTLAQISDRADDALQPGLVVTSGGTPAGSGYDSAEAAYTITATGGPLTFGVNASLPRHAPAFLIDGWTAPSWTLSRNGVVVASSAMPIGTGAIAFQNVAASRLVLVTVDVTPTAASDAERTFVLEAK